MGYSTEKDLQGFQENLGPNPMFVCDMDGNILIGYVLKEGINFQDQSRLENSENQSIPFDTSPKELEYYADQGFIKKEIFAAKSMDVRLPAHLVKAINDFNERGEPFRLTLLTSRSMDEALKILELSGVEEPQKVTLVADSGATLQINGEFDNVRPLSAEETVFFNSLDDVIKSKDFQDKLAKVIQAEGFDVSNMPALYIEPKGIAKNIHYRDILKHFEQPEGSKLDQRLTGLLKGVLGEQVESGPKDGDSLAFKLLDGPATVEVKIANVNKGHGLEAISNKAMASETPPSAVVFTGDDVSKLANDEAGPGTDYYAMIEADRLQDEHGVPFYNMHTQHPNEAGQPDDAKLPANLAPTYEVPRIDIIIPTPAQNGEFIGSMLGHNAVPRAEAKVSGPIQASGLNQS